MSSCPCILYAIQCYLLACDHCLPLNRLGVLSSCHCVRIRILSSCFCVLCSVLHNVPVYFTTCIVCCCSCTFILLMFLFSYFLFFFFCLESDIKRRGNRRGNLKWTNQRHLQYWAHRTQNEGKQQQKGGKTQHRNLKRWATRFHQITRGNPTGAREG